MWGFGSGRVPASACGRPSARALSLTPILLPQTLGHEKGPTSWEVGPFDTLIRSCLEDPTGAGLGDQPASAVSSSAFRISYSPRATSETSSSPRISS